MKPFSPDLMNLLASGMPLHMVDFYKIGPCMNGAMIYACKGGYKLTYEGNVYDPVAYGAWDRQAVTTKIGLSSNSVTLTLKVDNQVPTYFPGTNNGALMLDGIKYGLLGAQLGPAGGGRGIGGAPVTIYTAYMPKGQWGNVVGPNGGSLVETKFVGMVTTINKVGITRAEIQVQDLLYLLNLPVPRRLITPQCDWVLYSTGCTLSASNFSRAGTVGTVLNSHTFSPTGNLSLITSAGTFTQGMLVWSSGKNNGLANQVRLWTPGGANPDTIQLDIAPIFPLTSGDNFTIYQGCNKTFTACLDFFESTPGGGSSSGAYANFGGQPTVPVPETAL
jgi:hypothetical protein